ncbi:MAG TPA: MaoC family dehydratase N-terminal domain-containing protein [Acidimicrobiia bacterium]|nr:MaoC family dehydratase N-terminal domain-containing protein [Acidimicrobiia bacterium]
MDDSPSPLLVDTGFGAHAVSTVDEEHVRRVAACLDRDADAVVSTGRLPTLWHWACFLPAVATSALGPDGHPRRREEMRAFPRRMFGAGRVRVHEALRIGEPATRTSAITSAQLKGGSTGQFWVVTVAHEIMQRGELCIAEEQDVLLRAAGRTDPPGAARTDPPDATWVESRTPDEALLFRFSAITFNAHRIHYDRTYVVDVEHYPDLVVHGPLTAIWLATLVEDRAARPIRALRFRATAPLFVHESIWLAGGPSDDGATVTAFRSDHVAAMTLDAELA